MRSIAVRCVFPGKLFCAALIEKRTMLFELDCHDSDSPYSSFSKLFVANPYRRFPWPPAFSNHMTTQNVYDLEVLGTCMTNTRPGSQHVATVQPRHLWSFAQEEALIAVSELRNGCYELITDPERRARRIAGHYADLYFRSAEKSGSQMQFYWGALAAFVVKDIAEAYRFSRDEVLSGGFRNTDFSKLGSVIMAGGMP
jgi:hypothetical protein